MIASEPRPISRRNLLWLATTLALPAGCVRAPALDIKDVCFAAMGPEQVLLLGRIRLTVYELDRTETALIRTSAGPEERLLPEEGEVAWVVTHRPGERIWLGNISFLGGNLGPSGLLLVPAHVPSPLVYFGDVQFNGAAVWDDHRPAGTISKAGWTRVNDRGPAMASFVARNPDLRGRRVYDVIRNQLFDTPPALPAAPVAR